MQSYAYQNQYHHKNYSPLTKILKLSENSRDKYIPSEQEIDVFLNILSEPYLSASLISLYHGLLRGEVCHLELPDFDFENKTISIKPKPHLNWYPKNETSIRTVPIHPAMTDFLLDRYKKAARIGANFICFYDDDGHKKTAFIHKKRVYKEKPLLRGKQGQK
jgi:integrase